MEGVRVPVLRPLSRAEVRDVDRRAVDEYGICGIVLMENAGRGAADVLTTLGQDPGVGPVVVCAGKGNNGGDGFVLARHLENRGWAVRVLLFAAADALEGDAAVNFGILRRASTPVVEAGGMDAEACDGELRSAAWIVDALLGTGLQGDVREPMAGVIERINRSGRPILALDLPSGLDCDTGKPLAHCVRATATATFVARKRGFDAPGAADYTGQVYVVDIGVPRRLLADFLAR
jgi:NAD(P)H-hydrate epimerase